MDRLAQWFGAERLAQQMARLRAFWDGSERFIVSVNSGVAAYRQRFDAQDILTLAPRNLEHWASLPGLNLPSFYPDYGTISTAKYWGGHWHFDSTGGNMFVDPVAPDVASALRIAPSAPDAAGSDGQQGVALYHAICQQLATEWLWLRSPDTQGPLNTAALVVQQSELLMAMMSDPRAVHALLDGITDWEIAYGQYLRQASGGKVCGNIWPHTFLPADLGLSFTEDMMPLLSAKAYRTFATPYLRRLDQAFGGLLIHCCGDWGRHARTLADSGIRLRGVEFHYPFTQIEELDCLAADTVFIPYISLDKQDRFDSVSAYYDYLLTHTPDHYRYWFAWAEDSDEAVAFARAKGF